MKVFALAALLGTTMASYTDLCCTKCTGEGIIKTWSIDTTHNECGEGCIPEDKFWLYHIFEKNLTKASSLTATECANRGYTLYDKTETHGIPHVLSVTVDLYKTKEGALAEMHHH